MTTVDSTATATATAMATATARLGGGELVVGVQRAEGLVAWESTDMDERGEGAHALTKLQLALMRVLWERGSATVVEVQEALRAERPLAQTTVATLLSRLEKRGVVAYRTEGRQYVYRALVSEDAVRGSVLAEVTDRLFNGDVATLVSHLLTAAEVDASELARVRELIEARERELKGRRR